MGRSKTRDVGREPESARELVAMARLAMGVTGVDLAKQLGVASKTIERWLGGRTSIAAGYLGDLAPLVYPHDRALAARIHAHADRDLKRIGLAPPPPLPSEALPAETRAMSADEAKRNVDALLFAACDAMDAAPRVVRPAVLAAFRRARELGLSIEDVERALSPPAKTKR